MNTHDEERMKQLLKQALSPITDGEPARSLWPSMQQRLETQPTVVPWFDWALAGGLALFAVALPASIPVFFYYL